MLIMYNASFKIKKAYVQKSNHECLIPLENKRKLLNFEMHKIINIVKSIFTI